MMVRVSDQLDATVLIAGFGPVGGVLAALLGAQGVPTVVVEPNERPYPKPRAAILDVEAIRVLSTLPGLPPLSAWAAEMGRNGVVGPDHRPLIMLSLHATQFGHPQVVFLDQPALEAGLRTAIAGMDSVEVLNGRSVKGVEQSPDRVVAVLDDGRRLAARWLVGCDGVAGTVRDAAGIGFSGTTFAQPWLVVDSTTTATGPGVTGENDAVPEVAFVLDPTRPAVAMSRPGRWRWEWMLLPGEDPAEMTSPAALRPLITPWTDLATLEIQRAAVFTFHARMADRWRAGRVLLAGDAAHAMPPFAGAGLNTGIRDAIALAWRLAEAGDPAGLDAYERERRADVARLTKLALRIGRVVQTRNRALSRIQRTLIRGLRAVPGLQTRLGDRPLPVRRLPRAVAGPLARAGHVLPNPWVSVAGGPPVRLDEVIGYHWCFIGHGLDPRVTPEAEAHPGAVLLALDLADPPAGCLPIEDLDGLLEGAPGTVTAVRPDRFLHGVLSPVPDGK
jgi:3-(3-hydroxy-phenyl)propionate hydroxylase